MIRPLQTEFVIADGSRARWVSRSPETHDFSTVMELKAEREHRAGPQGVVFEASTGQRFSIEERRGAVAQRQARFAETVAERINKSKAERLVVVAPPRMLNAITERLSDRARARLAGSVAKNLTKTRDHELGEWLGTL